jgi:hypothetical protein
MEVKRLLKGCLNKSEDEEPFTYRREDMARK